MISANSAKSSAISALSFHRGDRRRNSAENGAGELLLSITVGAEHSGTERGSSDSFAKGISKSMDVMELSGWQTVRLTSAMTGVFGEPPKTHRKSDAICARAIQDEANRWRSDALGHRRVGVRQKNRQKRNARSLDCVRRFAMRSD